MSHAPIKIPDKDHRPVGTHVDDQVVTGNTPELSHQYCAAARYAICPDPQVEGIGVATLRDLAFAIPATATQRPATLTSYVQLRDKPTHPVKPFTCSLTFAQVATADPQLAALTKEIRGTMTLEIDEQLTARATFTGIQMDEAGWLALREALPLHRYAIFETFWRAGGA